VKSVRQVLVKKGTGVHTIAPNDSVLVALEQMADRNVGALVVQDDGEVVGLVSERDYARKVILQGKVSRDTAVHEIMDADPVSVGSIQTVNDCMELMTDRRVRHLPVIENGQLSGIISIGDVVHAIIDEQQSTIQDLEKYITGSQ